MPQESVSLPLPFSGKRILHGGTVNGPIRKCMHKLRLHTIRFGLPSTTRKQCMLSGNSSCRLRHAQVTIRMLGFPPGSRRSCMYQNMYDSINGVIDVIMMAMPVS